MSRKTTLKTIYFYPIVTALLVLAALVFGFFSMEKKEIPPIVDKPAEVTATPTHTPLPVPKKLFAYRDEESGLWGYKDETGVPTIEAKYAACQEFSQDRAFVGFTENGTIRYGIIDKTGKTIVEPQFDDARPFFGGYAAYKLGTNWGYMDLTGKIIISPQYETAGDFHESLAKVSQNGKYGYIDVNGNIKIELEYLSAQDFSEGVAFVGQKDDTNIMRYFIISSNGSDEIIAGVGRSEGTIYSNGFAAVKAADKTYTFYNKKGRPEKESLKFEGAKNFSQGLAAVKKGGLWGFIDVNMEEKIDFQFEDALPFSDGYAAVKKDGLWGYIDASGGTKIDFIYNEAKPFMDGYAIARQNNTSICVVDKAGGYKQLYIAAQDSTPAQKESARVKVDKGTLRMRGGPSTDTQKVGEIPNGTEVKILGIDGEWTQVDYNGIVGYVMSSYLE